MSLSACICRLYYYKLYADRFLRKQEREKQYHGTISFRQKIHKELRHQKALRLCQGTSRSNAGRTASCLLYTSDAADERSSVLLVGLGLLCVALVLVPGQNFWSTLRSWYFGIFGITTYLVGPFLLYLAYLLASGYRVALFAGKVSLMGVLCASVPVIFSKLNVESLKVGEIIKMLFTRGGTYFWEGGVLGAPIGATLLALFGRPASNIIMLLALLLGVTASYTHLTLPTRAYV